VSEVVGEVKLDLKTHTALGLTRAALSSIERGRFALTCAPAPVEVGPIVGL